MLSNRCFHSRNRGLGSSNPLGKLSLRKAGLGARLENLIQQTELLLELIVLATHFRARQRAPFEIFKKRLKRQSLAGRPLAAGPLSSEGLGRTLNFQGPGEGNSHSNLQNHSTRAQNPPMRKAAGSR
jgi:hypothetical protein